MTDIVAFLTARLDEEAERLEWILGCRNEDDDFDGGWNLWGDFGRAIDLAFRPARLLADIEAKRRIVERHRNYDFPFNQDDGPGDYSWTGCCDFCHQPWPCPDLRDVAAPYAGRPGYLESWRP